MKRYLIFIVIALLIIFALIGYSYKKREAYLTEINNIVLESKETSAEKENEKSKKAIQTISETSTSVDNEPDSREELSILLVGLDTRKHNYKGRSDSVMALKYSPQLHKLKLLSFMRDLRVDIEGYGFEKLGHAYAYGQEKLLKKTLKNNFGLEIDNYVVWNFHDMKNFVDIIGGIELDIPKNEINMVNSLVYDVNSNPKIVLKESMRKNGVFKVNGELALSYSRVRKIGNGDFERTKRQHIVISKIVEKLSTYSENDIINLLNEYDITMPSNLDKTQILNLYQSLKEEEIEIEIEAKRIPSDNTFREGKLDGLYYLMIDKDWDVKKEVNDFLEQ